LVWRGERRLRFATSLPERPAISKDQGRGGRSSPPPDRGWREGQQAYLASDGVFSPAAMLSRYRAAVASAPALSQGTEAHHIAPFGPRGALHASGFQSAEGRDAAPYRPCPVVMRHSVLSLPHLGSQSVVIAVCVLQSRHEIGYLFPQQVYEYDTNRYRSGRCVISVGLRVIVCIAPF
jgi:hypothetical protein